MKTYKTSVLSLKSNRERPAPISDGDQIFDKGSATVDRQARDLGGPNRPMRLVDREKLRGWGFRLKIWLENLRR